MRVRAAVRRLNSTGLITIGLIGTSLFGCQKAQEKVMEEAAERAIENEAGGDAKVELNGGAVKIEANGAQVQMDAQNGVKLPENLPKDLFIPADAKITVSNTTSEGAMIIFEQAMGLDKASSMMREGMQKNGWTQSADLNMNGTRTITYTKGEQEAALMMTGDGSATTTNMSVSFK